MTCSLRASASPFGFFLASPLVEGFVIVVKTSAVRLPVTGNPCILLPDPTSPSLETGDSVLSRPCQFSPLERFLHFSPLTVTSTTGIYYLFMCLEIFPTQEAETLKNRLDHTTPPPVCKATFLSTSFPSPYKRESILPKWNFWWVLDPICP